MPLMPSSRLSRASATMSPSKLRDDLGAVAVGADLERVLALEFEQQGDLVEDLRNLFAGDH